MTAWADLGGGLARASDPDTSHEAALSISVANRELSEKAVLWALSLGAATDETIADRIRHDPRWPRWTDGTSRFRTARKQLVDAGRVMDTGQKAKLSSGRAGIVWALVPDDGQVPLFEAVA